MTNAGNQTRERTWTAYGSTLALLMIAVVVLITFGSAPPWPSLAGGLQGLALLATLEVSRVRRIRLLRLGTMAMVASMLAAELANREHPMTAVAVPLLWSLVVMATIAAILRNVRSFPRIDAQTVLGLLAVYVLLGLLFAWTFVLVENLDCPFFSSGERDLGAYIYFSYVNLTSVGFGDLSPRPGLPRALSVVEAILGQVYLVSVVALAVSRYGSPPRQESEPPSS